MRFDIARSRRALAALALVATAAAVPLLGQSQEPVDLQAIFKIKDEGLQRSKVMEITSYLTDVYGPRLTGSPNIRKAGEWATYAGDLASIGNLCVKLGRWGDAKKTMEECLAIREKVLPPNDWRLANARGLLGVALANLGQRDKAEPLLVSSAATIAASVEAPPNVKADAQARLALLRR